MRTLLTIAVLTMCGLLLSCDIIAGTKLESAVKKALADDPRTSSYSFEVSLQDDGSVLITGEIYKPDDFAAVTEIAKSVEGVERVTNRTRVPEEGSGMVQDHVVPSPFL